MAQRSLQRLHARRRLAAGGVGEGTNTFAGTSMPMLSPAIAECAKRSLIGLWNGNGHSPGARAPQRGGFHNFGPELTQDGIREFMRERFSDEPDRPGPASGQDRVDLRDGQRGVGFAHGRMVIEGFALLARVHPTDMSLAHGRISTAVTTPRPSMISPCCRSAARRWY